MAAMVEYPSLRHFQDMTASDEYAEIHVDCETGLAHSLLINC